MKKNTITYIVIIVLVLIGVYWAYHLFSSKGSKEVAGVTVTTGAGEDVSLPVDEVTNQANQFIQILDNVGEVTLSERSLLTNKMFQTGLQDFGKPLEDRPIGRANPFAPASGESFTQVKTSAVATTTPTPTPKVATPPTNLFTQ